MSVHKQHTGSYNLTRRLVNQSLTAASPVPQQLRLKQQSLLMLTYKLGRSTNSATIP
jgi:hypothetical protein